VTEHHFDPAAANQAGDPLPGDPVPDLDAVVVGAGFAGLYALHRLRAMGLSVRVFEQAEDVGGTWYWNRYPGARCDVESIDYSFSFSEELQQEWSWTERYATQPEILRYLNHVADRFGLRPDITFGTRVVAAVYDEPSARWVIETDRGHRVTARHAIMAVGNLSVGRIPEFPGRESFRGRAYHTGTWPKEGVDLTGLRVGVIGTGSSGIQVIPLIAQQAAHLTVFQRTAHYTIPAQHHRLDPGWLAEFKRLYPDYRRRMRVSRGGLSRDYSERRALETPPEQRRRTYEARWGFGGAEILGSFADLLTDEQANQTVAEFVAGKIREIVRDPEVAGQLIPRGYPFGAKRLCVDTGYYETYNRDNVRLVDVTENPIEAVTPAGIRTSAGEHELDAIVFATGFDAMTGALLAMDVRGRGGLGLRQAWEAGPQTYLGVGVAGFPNMFIITGPGSPSVLSNVVLSIEQHVEWVCDFIEHLRKHDLDWAEPRLEAQRGWVAHVNDVAGRTLFTVGNSWYLGANVPGKPRVFMPYIGGVGRYRAICDQVAAAGYAGFDLGSVGQAPEPEDRQAPEPEDGQAPARDAAPVLQRVLTATEAAAVADAEGAWG
jgi:cation diffusion facilitator CzcD-associated flavoprotein CzcO